MQQYDQLRRGVNFQSANVLLLMQISSGSTPFINTLNMRLQFTQSSYNQFEMFGDLLLSQQWQRQCQQLCLLIVERQGSFCRTTKAKGRLSVLDDEASTLQPICSQIEEMSRGNKQTLHKTAVSTDQSRNRRGNWALFAAGLKGMATLSYKVCQLEGQYCYWSV